MQIGMRIKELRKRKGWSQDELCHHAGLKREYLSRVENEHTTPALSTLRRIASALQVSLSHLVDIPDHEEYTSEQEPSSSPREMAQAQPTYQAVPPELIQEIESVAEEMCNEFKRRIKAILERRNF